MPTILQSDRKPLASTRPRMRPQRGAVVVLAVLLLVALGVGVGGAVGRWLPGLPTPETIDRSPAALLIAVRNIADYHAATGTYQVVVDLEHDTKYVPEIVSSERSTLLATGSVDARVDFSSLGAGAVTISPDRRQATIRLPAPTLAPATIDPAQTRVVGRERGLVQRVEDAVGDHPRDDSELYQLATKKLDAAAAQSDLTGRAATNTRAMLTGLAQSLGYDTVTVTFGPPAPPAP
ncbi:MAG TPA: DUF4230 domain-containing protein [Pseudonocardia sp.]